MGAANETLNKSIQMHGGGKEADTITLKTGTVSSALTAVTGTGTLFTTEYEIGGKIVIGTNVRYIRDIISDTSMTINQNLTAAAGTAISKPDAQFAPPVLYFEDNRGDHNGQSVFGNRKGVFLADSGHFKSWVSEFQVTSSRTITTTAGSHEYTLSGNEGALRTGEVVYVPGMAPKTVVRLTASTGFFTEPAEISVAGSAFNYINANRNLDNVSPDDNTDGNYFNMEAFKDYEKTIASSTSEESIFNTAPEISNFNFAADRGLRLVAFGDLVGNGEDLKIRAKLGGTTICTNATDLTLSADGTWTLEIIVLPNNDTADQNTLINFRGAAAADVIRENQNSTVDTQIVQDFDVSFECTTGGGIAYNIKGKIGSGS
jgi:hypothetical protein